MAASANLAPTEQIDELIDEFSVDQDYGHYSEEDQGTWRIAMSELKSVLVSNTAVDYVHAFHATGMSPDRIPTLACVNNALNEVGWSAIVVDGFIPPDVFMALQANSILPISRPIRARSQLGYTPIPDIIHEAAGHLPMLSCPAYRVFLQRLGEIGANTHLNDTDMNLYNLQKHLAELHAEDGVDPQEILDAERAVAKAADAARDEDVSPARRVARFHWWTVEYGLIGPNHDIYGAGLLSSVAEARDFRSANHVRLTVDCCNQPFEIDHVQPRYYVADSWAHLMDEVEALAVSVAN
ncbi:MAG: hypothetical protein OXG08_08645 [Gammaproteobacteria bacterium]|nr:hypothetical protein [Gammaproteobacteria bacterium]